MMSIILMLIFMIPMSNLYKNYWLNQFMYMSMTFLFLIKMEFNNFINNVSYIFMLDLLSYLMILLSFWICSLMILASVKIFHQNNFIKVFMFMMIMMLISLVLVFSSMNLFIFYFFFEMSLIPILIIVIGWGYQPERIQAGLYLIFYTLLGSLPMMVFIFNFYKMSNSMLMYNMLSMSNIFMFMFMIVVFLVKVPMYFIHLWLPKAHVEAPIAGSMILAGVMLKLGGYGLLRLMPIFVNLNLKLNYILINISLIGGLFVSVICLRQSDMKSLVAYSSIAHMSLVLSSVMTYSNFGLIGGLMMMLSHGLSSSGLFCLINIIYERIFSRSLFMSKGLINLMPSFSLWWFLLCSSNMAAPPSFNLLSEIILISSLIYFSKLMMLIISMIMFFSAAYSMFLYSYSQHGKFYSGLFSTMNINNREYLLLVLHWLPLNIMFLKSNFFSMWV